MIEIRKKETGEVLERIQASSLAGADLRDMLLSGADRHEKWAEVPDADLVVTSYALLRRDIEQYVSLEFSAAVLDGLQEEARSTGFDIGESEEAPTEYLGLEAAVAAGCRRLP